MLLQCTCNALAMHKDNTFSRFNLAKKGFFKMNNTPKVQQKLLGCYYDVQLFAT